VYKTLLNQTGLESEQASALLKAVAAGELNPSQMASILSVYLVRGVTVEELDGFRKAMLQLALPFDPGRPCLDVCGTGGDGKNTFNISTLTAFVVAACGIPVAKHGNYGVSSVSGSSNVLEIAGYRFTADTGELTRQLDECNICFMHAPLFHPAMKTIAPIRKELGVKTFFNMLGPLVNPANPQYRMCGVFSLELARQYHYLLQQDEKPYAVIHAHEGYDELTLTGKARVYSDRGESDLDANSFGFDPVKEQDLTGGETTELAAKLFVEILSTKNYPAKQIIVAANAALAIHTVKPEISLTEAAQGALEAIHSGKAFETFQKLINLSQHHA
jgi:anthranilate phosphoribosyltransferase